MPVQIKYSVVLGNEHCSDIDIESNLGQNGPGKELNQELILSKEVNDHRLWFDPRSLSDVLQSFNGDVLGSTIGSPWEELNQKSALGKGGGQRTQPLGGIKSSMCAEELKKIENRELELFLRTVPVEILVVKEMTSYGNHRTQTCIDPLEFSHFFQRCDLPSSG